MARRTRKKKSSVALPTLRRAAIETIIHENVDNGDHVSEIASELARLRVYGCKPMSIRELEKYYEVYQEFLEGNED